MNAQSKLIITVTSAEGRPTFSVPGDTARVRIAALIRQRFGMQTGDGWALPHSFCGALLPALQYDPPQVSFLVQRGHHRVV